MSENNERTTVILGAGASADAGLPLTSALAEEVVRRANAERREYASAPWVEALNVVYASMVGHRGQDGLNPLDAVNIETLISAVRLLAERDEHEVAPFVSAWNSGLSNIGQFQLPPQVENDLGEGIAEIAGPEHRIFTAKRKVASAVQQIAQAVVAPNLGAPLREAERRILMYLVEILGAHTDVAYLRPLTDLARMQPGGLDVITLNYDLTVEDVAQSAGVPVYRGVDHWAPGEDVEFRKVDGRINLLKMHGSLDWLLESADYVEGKPQRIRIIDADETSRPLPWIVVGDREKLATDGPTLTLNHAARAVLRETTHLVIVGYSFGDAHLNNMVRDWLFADKSRTLSVLDLSWPKSVHSYSSSNFRSIIQWFAQARTHPEVQGPRSVLVEGTANTHLAKALQARPLVLPERLLRLEADPCDEDQVRLTWLGPALEDATVYATRGHQRLFVESLEAPQDEQERPNSPYRSYGEQAVTHWETGGNIRVRVIRSDSSSLPSQSDASATITVSGTSCVGLLTAELPLPTHS